MGKSHGLFLFASVHHALKFERELGGAWGAKLVPVPRDISSSCGVALRVEVEEPSAEELCSMVDPRKGVEGFYLRDGSSWRRLC